MPAPSLLFIGLDGMEASLIEAGAADGTLPNFRRLIDASRWSRFDAPIGLGNDATWSSFHTGQNPGRIGRYFVRQVKPGSYRSEYLTEADVHGEPFWEWAARDGMRVAAVDMPYSAVRPTNGIVVADWRVHGPLYHHVTTTSPAELAATLHERFGPDPVGPSDRPGVRGPRELVALRDGLRAKNDHKRRYTAELLEAGTYDLVAVAFTDAHCAGHQFWHLHEPTTDADRALATSVGDLVVDLYRAVDESVGALLDLVDGSTTVVAFTGPGMGPNHTASHLLDDVLRAVEPDAAAPRRRIVDPLRAGYRRVVPPSLRARLRSRADALDEALLVGNRQARRFYGVPSNELAGAIRCNVIGREPHGRVAVDELPAVTAELSEILHELRNAETGEPIVESVHLSRDLFDGEYVDWLPDILVVWSRTAPVRGVRSARIGEIWRTYPGNRTGDHNEICLAAVRAPGLGAGELHEPLATMDLTASMAALAGITIPDGIDGRVRADLSTMG